MKSIYQKICLKNEHSQQKDHVINLAVKHKQRRNTDQTDVTYYAQCPKGNCQEDFADETERSLSKRAIDNSGRNKQSHVLFVIKLYAPNKSILCNIGVWPLFCSRQTYLNLHSVTTLFLFQCFAFCLLCFQFAVIFIDFL